MGRTGQDVYCQGLTGEELTPFCCTKGPMVYGAMMFMFVVVIIATPDALLQVAGGTCYYVARCVRPFLKVPLTRDLSAATWSWRTSCIRTHPASATRLGLPLGLRFTALAGLLAG
ncbi:hypothetical protein HYPSUDRAFT_341454 [Hypholoma sublateritium FD-334 SS-4]|uniref:Uncharacterized protein n=1 Tax=Hypholoma sublateritium (strain FD-334 SS-4) TaxID=945553 RepID=A0A0D2Q332_HYPSF|nr:hypothetical protein HYPSUDRAFT_341454 [Hypholoma sublateritium FD-334 SS-4]